MKAKKERKRTGLPLAAVLALLALPCACRTTSDDVTVGGTGDGGLPDPVVEPVDVDPDPPEPVEPEYRSVLSRGGGFTVRWRPVPESIPTNDHFELDVKLFRGDGTAEPLGGVRLIISGWMPAHKHGMLVAPGATEVAPGHYRVEGMLFHMGGHWQLFFDVIEESTSERAAVDLQL